MRNVTRSASTDTFPSFSHDGAWILFQLRSERRAVHLENSGRGRYSDTGLACARVDGARIERRRVSVPTSKARRRQVPGPLWQVPLKGGAPIKLVDGVSAVNHRPRRRRCLLSGTGARGSESPLHRPGETPVDPRGRQSRQRRTRSRGIPRRADDPVRADRLVQQRPHAGGQLSLTCTGTAGDCIPDGERVTISGCQINARAHGVRKHAWRPRASRWLLQSSRGRRNSHRAHRRRRHPSTSSTPASRTRRRSGMTSPTASSGSI